MDADRLDKLRKFAQRILVDGRPLLERPTQLAELSRVGLSGWKLMARLENGEYLLTDHLQKGDEGSIVFSTSILRSTTGDQPAIIGWIGTGTNRFQVTEVVDIDGVLFHVGKVVEGGFHASKMNTAMWRSDDDEQE
jgi:hypothetical protein